MPQHSVEVVTQVLTAVEQRRADRLQALYHPQIEFHWQPGLPYSGTFVDAQVAQMQRRFGEVWTPLQPDEDTRRMDFRVIATGEDGRVVVSYRWKGLDAQGRHFETDTLADYQVRDGLLARARMYYDDLPGLIAFLAQAAAEPDRPPPNAHEP
jgi:ketosteroid isomerase-like protein